jgi:CRISPR/Cas system-associated exonuclease Cas4 (RecB family)
MTNEEVTVRISYNAYKDFTECPKRFSWKYVERKHPTVRENDYHKLYGNLMGKFFELYSNVWRLKTPYLFPEVIKERMERIYLGQLISADVRWEGMPLTQEQLLQQAIADAVKVMEEQTLNYFLNTKSEITIDVRVATGDLITGRPDFVHLNVDKSVVLFDGKGTSKKGRNVSEDQLLFYALLFYLHYKQMPWELGFFYYRLNEFVPVTVNTIVLDEFRARLSLAVKAMTKGPFPANPKSTICKYCPYENSCAECTAAKAARVKESTINVPGGEGVTEFGFA